MNFSNLSDFYCSNTISTVVSDTSNTICGRHQKKDDDTISDVSLHASYQPVSIVCQSDHWSFNFQNQDGEASTTDASVLKIFHI